jgi:cellulose synthase operon protein C
VSLTLDDLQTFLGPPAADAAMQPYLDAAAVLAAFDLVALRPFRGEARPDDRLVERLLPSCEPITEGSGRGLWTLSLADRRAGLRRLGSRERMSAALAANPKRVQTPAQRIFERVLGAEPIALEELSRDELAAAITVGEWLRGLLDGIPEEAAVRRALARHDLIAPMRRLTAGGFVNREQELVLLAEHVSGPPPVAPLFIHGPGGVGKSTLLAKFLLDELERPDRAIAYIDIDRPTIVPEQPLTLLLEALAQLRTQLELSPKAIGLGEQIAESLGRVEDMRQLESAGTPDDWLLEQFRDLLADVPGDVTSIVVVDTFEEAQFLGPDVIWPLVEFLHRLPRAAPMVRVVVSGRTLPEPPPAEPVDLGVLDFDSARELLATSIELAGLPKLTPQELDDVIGVVTSNPMCLKLAVRLLRDEGVEKLRSTRSEVLARLKAEKVQALLYGRVLHHIHTEDVRQIAYPGLIVRRITADVIRDVLAGPCKIELTPERNEYAILWDLQREAALVEVDPEDGSLRHRTDVRRAMLEDLEDHVEPEIVAAIDDAAVAFYARQDGPIARAEEIYHRLRRRDSVAELEDRWLPSAGSRLKFAGDELPPQQRLWLAEKLGATLDPSVREAASQEAWEAQAALSADRYLQSRFAEQALEVLHERKERLPRSELHSLETEAYRFLGRHDDALRVARAGVESMTRAGAIDMALELLLKMVNIEEGREGHAAAGVLADEAAAVATHTPNVLLRLRAAVTELRVQRRHAPDAQDVHAALALLTPELLHELRSRAVLLREVAAELAQDDPRVASAAFETLGVELATDEQAELLGRALVSLEQAELGKGALSPPLRHALEAIEESGSDPAIIREWSQQRTSGRDVRDIAKALAACQPGDEVLRAFRDYFRAGVDHGLRGVFTR